MTVWQVDRNYRGLYKIFTPLDQDLRKIRKWNKKWVIEMSDVIFRIVRISENVVEFECEECDTKSNG